MSIRIGCTAFLVIGLGGCATIDPAQSDRGQIFAGLWGESVEDCRVNPQRISFSPAADTMYVRYPQGGTADNKTLQEEFVYRVLAATDKGLHVDLVGEERRDASGRAVTWDMVHLSDSRFCWRRSDWEQDACTVPRVRCER